MSGIGTVGERRELLAIALDVAREASKLVEKGWRRGVTPEHKGPVDLVTQFDRESEEFLRKALHERTSFSVTGEEGGPDAAASNAPTWYVDPIDGTTNFVHGHPFYCVSVGLARGPECILGAIVAPALRTEWKGFVGIDDSPGISQRNEEPCRVSGVDKFVDSLLATGFPYERSRAPDNNFDAFVSIKKQCQAVRRCGSAALDLCLVADGTYDGYWEKGLRPWDMAAGAAIVLAAGGSVSRYDGTDGDVRIGEVIATNGKIHAALIDALARVAV
jgi:myo-inositol-1(or 4)-monophosphatase